MAQHPDPNFITSVMIQGDAIKTNSTDLIAQLATINVGEPIPEGWSVTTGNMHYSEIVRIVYRYQIEEEAEDATT